MCPQSLCILNRFRARFLCVCVSLLHSRGSGVPCVLLFCDAHTVYMAEHAMLVIVLGIHCSTRSPQPELTSYFVQFLEVGILG